ncbi:ABC transporter permease [Zobellella iuensis]|uniref:ABC transporter permease n=1 Tax=Zobellella iuensis TaxID=2803811 RepID=A0ABS1QN80_9GAMM|nr:ABC transporter permease [Zobellella iuensis]MBL1376316.1 ABC transporter permease [Zobellella iuensis]
MSQGVFPSLRRRLLHMAPTVFGILVLNFLLLQSVPGDVVDVLAAESGGASAESMALLREQLGLTASWWQQFGGYLADLARFDLGMSLRFNMPVLELILSRLPNTLLLVGGGLLLALALGLAMGVAMAVWAGRWPERVLSLLNLLLYSMPGFWFGLMVILVFSVTLGWLPANGHATIGQSLSGGDWLWDRLRHAVLPIVTLATFFIAVYARLIRAAMLDLAGQDFIRTARAKGLSPARILLRHHLRNALLPVTTMAGMHFAALFGGAAVTESVFGWPGIGRLTLEAVLARDFNLLLGILLLSSLLVVVINALVDALQLWLDPRMRDH